MKFILLLVLFAPAYLFAQNKNDYFKYFKNLKARSIGPAGMSGRVTSIDAVHTNPNIIYIGTASGGVWKTENSGHSWTPVFDDQPILNIGSVAIQQSNPSVVWVGTGEGNPRNSLNIGGGIYKSVDGGKSWKSMGLEATKNIHRIIIDPNNPDVVYAGAIGNPYGIHSERGVFKTTDGGKNWKKILYTNDTSGVADMVMDPSNPNKLFVAMWQHHRTPYSFKSGGPGSGLYVTYDGGESFKQLNDKNGLPKLPYGRIGLAIARSMPNRVYALVEATKNGLYRSDDGGEKWELVNSQKDVVENRPFYFQEIAVDSKNENRVYNIYQMISLSEDGGKNFKVIIPYSGIHPDHHAFWIHPTDPNLIIEGNDGGIGISRDRGKTWIFDDKIPVGQFYHVNVDNELPYNIMGGMQDNGSWFGPAYTQNSAGIRNYDWITVGGGDGFDVSGDPTNPKRIYSMSQGGNLGTYNIETGENSFIKPIAPDTATRLRFNWNAAFAQDPFDGSTIYYGSQFVHKSTDKGLTWSIISPDLTTNNKKQQDQSANGGLSIDITGAENYNTILAIEPSKLDKNIIWAGTDDGNVQLTKDGGKTWTNFRGKINGMPEGCWIPQVKAGRHNKGEAFVVANDYRRGNFKPYIFRTTDYGVTWKNILENKNTNGYALCVLQDPVEPNLIFVGTEQGLYISVDNGNSFNQFKNNYPSVSTYDLALQERENDLAIGTFGRALYIIDDISPLRKLAAKGFSKSIEMLENNTAYMFETKTTPGYEWSTWGLYEGENKNKNAAINVMINPFIKDTTIKKIDSVQVLIYNDKNEEIRNFKTKVDSGFNRIYWNYTTKGKRWIDSPLPKKDDNEPVGYLPLVPGNYKVVIKNGKIADSANLKVLNDPKIPFNASAYKERLVLIQQLDSVHGKLLSITDAIRTAEESLDKTDNLAKNSETAAADSIKSWNKSMRSEMSKLRELVVGKKQEKQGYGQVPQLTPLSKFQEASYYIYRRKTKPTTQEYQLLNEAQVLANDVHAKASKFFNTEWANYQKKIEALQSPLFKKLSL